MPTLGPSTDGLALYGLVEAYAALGDHRTGTDVDQATAAWMTSELAARGLTVEAQPLGFERWVVTSRLLCDQQPIAHLPLPYEWTGSVNTDNVHVGQFDPKSGGIAGFVEPHIEAAEASGAQAAVLATTHPEGSLVAINRPLGAPTSDFPTVLVAGRDHDRLTQNPISLDMAASVEPGHSSNVVATNGLPGRPLVLTTPLNGWFSCAGERGSGIAVLLHLVECFSDKPLVVVATGGHELGYFGGHHWVGSTSVTPAAVVHVGASVAVEEGPPGRRRLARTRLAMTSLQPDRAGPVAAALVPAALDLDTGTERWLGEGEAFCRLGAHLLSFTGAGLDFHTPDDTPSRATSPTALATTAHAIADAASALWNTTSMETP